MNNAIITLHEIDGQPLVHDENLARELGFAAPRQIRQTIGRNRAELESYGPLVTLRDKSRGQDFTVYYLNEEQALLICMLSRAPLAKEVRREIIAVYQAWRKGHLKPSFPDFNDPIVAARAWADEVEKKRIAQAKIEKDAPKVANWEAFQNTGATTTTGTLAKEMGFRSAQALHSFLHEEGVIFPRKDRPRSGLYLA